MVRSSDGTPTYDIASSIADYLENITHIIRADDLITSTYKHLMLMIAIQERKVIRVPEFMHMPLLRSDNYLFYISLKSQNSEEWSYILDKIYQENISKMGWQQIVMV